MKKLLICLTVLFSAFLFTNKVSAETLHHIDELEMFSQPITEDYLYTVFNMDKEAYPYVILYTSNSTIPETGTNLRYRIRFLKSSTVFRKEVGGLGIYKKSGFSYYYESSSVYAKVGGKEDITEGLTLKNGDGTIQSSFYEHIYYFSNFDILSYVYDNGFNNVDEVALPANNTIPSYNVTFHLNGGTVFDTNWVTNEIGTYMIGNKYEDYTSSIASDGLYKYLINQEVTKEPMQFFGWYYDEKLTQKVEAADILNSTLNSDKDFYAKYIYKNVDDFLNNTTFNNYTFDNNYQYAVISLGDNSGEIYLGLDFMTYNLEVYKYLKTNNNYKETGELCLTPYYSKNDKYYYIMNTGNFEEYEVLIIPKEKLNGKYNFMLSDNAYVTYTNDLKEVVIKDENGNDLTTDLEDKYNYNQDALLNSENDLLDIFKDLINNKNNNVFSYFNQVWNYMRSNKLFTYFMLLIIGSLVILIIKAASR